MCEYKMMIWKRTLDLAFLKVSSFHKSNHKRFIQITSYKNRNIPH